MTSFLRLFKPITQTEMVNVKSEIVKPRKHKWPQPFSSSEREFTFLFLDQAVVHCVAFLHFKDIHSQRYKNTLIVSFRWKVRHRPCPQLRQYDKLQVFKKHEGIEKPCIPTGVFQGHENICHRIKEAKKEQLVRFMNEATWISLHSRMFTSYQNIYIIVHWWKIWYLRSPLTLYIMII